MLNYDDGQNTFEMFKMIMNNMLNVITRSGFVITDTTHIQDTDHALPVVLQLCCYL